MTKIFIGLSGGVDSSVAAKLLLDQGHSVTGVFIKIWQPEFLECTWKEDRLAAKRSAAALGIPFIEVDLSEEYRRTVIEDMIREYKKGLTPNPDVLCNKHIKFGVFLTWAKANGAEKIATGHYARIHTRSDGALELHRGKDATKDQSYFLYQLTQNDLRDTCFPIGALTKRAVRAIALRAKLPSAKRPDSQGLCFVGNIELGEFLSRFIPMCHGNVVNAHGTIIGEHQGAARYTVGQRHGFRVFSSTPDQSPYYVVDVITEKNILIVSDIPQQSYALRIELASVNWINEMPKKGILYGVSVRYHQPPQMTRITCTGIRTTIDFKKPQHITIGQSAVVYDSERCIGGGIIVSSEKQ